ncbi:MAG: multiheme c-type cytochrome, partial [Syntrophothermus sp.]
TPTPATCQKCHSKQVEQFASGKHAMGWKALEVVPNFAKLPAPVAQSGCIGCHQVGYVWADGSQGKCDSCHSRHSFSAAEANEPEACGTCHAGDHPQYEMWSNSKHGKLYQMTRDGSRAPKCQTCHMQGGDHKAITAWGFLGMRGEEPDAEWRKIRVPTETVLKLIGPGNAPGVTRQTFAEWQAERQKMLDTCSQCHATSFARRALERGDAVIKESDKVFGQIGTLAMKLHNEKAIDDKTQSAILREALAHRFSAYMGTFHGAYRFAWDEGYLPLTDALVQLGERAKK